MAGAVQVREAEDFAEGIAKGAKLTYIDPRLSESAVNATNFLQINPGTDMALALGMIHVIIRDDIFNAEFIQKYGYGFDQLVEHGARARLQRIGCAPAANARQQHERSPRKRTPLRRNPAPT